MSPRKSSTDMIAELEQKLLDARQKVNEKRKAEITKLGERRVALVEREQKIAGQILEVDEAIAELVAESGADLDEEIGDFIAGTTSQLSFVSSPAEEV